MTLNDLKYIENMLRFHSEVNDINFAIRNDKVLHRVTRVIESLELEVERVGPSCQRVEIAIMSDLEIIR